MDKILKNLPKGINPETIKQLLADRKAMIAASRESFFYFFLFYFGHHLEFPLAPFHFKMFRLAQDEEIKRAVVMSFRNSGKTTILNTAYALWAIMGKPQKKHVVIASQTQQRSRDHLMNIRKEIEGNKLLSENLGPFNIGEDRWGATTLIIPAYSARISVISVEEGIRGLKEGPYRPNLLVADDIEDSNSVKTRQGRDKTFDWLTGELIPLGASDVKLVVLGNFLHQDSVLSRLEEKIKNKEMDGVFLRVPIVGKKNNIAWPEKFTSLEAVEQLRRGIGNELTWQRDFMLRAIPSDFQIIKPEWIKYYKVMPKFNGKHYLGTFIGIDPAGSDNERADCTAMVMASVFKNEDNIGIFIHPNPVNKRMGFNEIKEQATLLSKTAGNNYPVTLIVEDTGIQKWLAQDLEYAGMVVETFRVGGIDKSSRLNAASSLMQAGKVFFPEKEAEELIQQLVGFELERFDDLADAFSLLLLKIMEINNTPEPRITFI